MTDRKKLDDFFERVTDMIGPEDNTDEDRRKYKRPKSTANDLESMTLKRTTDPYSRVSPIR